MNQIISSIADIKKIEAVPLAKRELPASTYAAIKKSAQAQPDALAMRYVENGESWRAAKDRGDEHLSVDITYAELLSNVNRTANLFSSLGVGEKDVVSMILPNIPEAHYVLWGAEACGIVNPINYFLRAEEIGAIVQSAKAKILVVMGKHSLVDIAEKLSIIREHAPCVEHVLVVGDLPDNTDDYLSFDELLKAQRADQLDFQRPISPDDIASLFQTGGTTGLPKLAQHTHGNEVYAAWAINTQLRAGKNDRFLVGLPLFHCNAAIATGLSSFMHGVSLLLAGINGYRTPGIVANMFGFIEYYRITNFSAVPTIFAGLVQQSVDGFDLSSLRMAGSGAAPMPVELFKRFKAITGVQTVEGYGLTEATVVSTMTPPAASTPRIGSIGLRLPYTEIKLAILDSKGNFVRDCLTDEVGSLLIRGPSVTPGYTDTSKNSALFVTDNEGKTWLNSGDLARQDSSEYFWLTGRSKELIIRGGHNIDPKIIEEALSTHPAVNLAAAIGWPDAYAGELPVAYVDTIDEVTAEELLRYCQQNIGERAAIPKSIVILDKLPVTGVGKIHKPTLHLMALKSVVVAEIDKLSESIIAYTVDTKMDPKLGNVAHVSIKCASPTIQADIEKQLNQTLGAYSFVFQINLIDHL